MEAVQEWWHWHCDNRCEMMDIEILQNLLIEKDSYVPPCLEFHFDLRGPLDGPTVDREELGHSNDSLVYSFPGQKRIQNAMEENFEKTMLQSTLCVFVCL